MWASMASSSLASASASDRFESKVLGARTWTFMKREDVLSSEMLKGELLQQGEVDGRARAQRGRDDDGDKYAQQQRTVFHQAPQHQPGLCQMVP